MVKKLKQESAGVSLDDAFADDEDVVYSESKPRKVKAKTEAKLKKTEEENSFGQELKQSKPIEQIKRGDKVKVDGKEYEVDAHYMLMDLKTTKEMTIEIFDRKTDKDFQLRYFTGRLENGIEFYELQGEILYVKKPCHVIEW